MKYILTLFATLIFFSGCATTTYTKPIAQGKIENPNIVITARDGSFKLQSEFKSPFQSRVHYHSFNISGQKFIKGHHRALGFDAKHVLVKVPSHDKELYGVLALDNADNRGIGSGTESYKIIIPEPYIDAARDGKISVVYEYYHLDNEGITDLSEVKKYSWILWISDEDVFK